MIFKYKGVDQEGKKVSSTLEATSLAEAKVKLKTQGIIYTEIKEYTTAFRFHFSKRLEKISPKELATLSLELAMYIRSGISIHQALKIIKNQYFHNKKMSLFLNSVATYVDEGESFYQALEKQDVVALPAFYKQSIRVSENAGILDEVLLELSRFLKEQERLHKEVGSALTYPAFMILVALIMIAFMLTFVVPQISAIFTNMHQELPAITQFVVKSGAFFQHHYMIIFGILVIVLGGIAFFLQFSKKFRYFIDALLLKIPFFGKLIQKQELARFSYMSSLLLRSGVSFVQTIQLSANILKNSVLAHLFEKASVDVVEGKLLSQSLLQTKPKLDVAFIQAIALGEETSEVEKVLQNISQLYFEESKDKISFLLTLLEPALMLFVGGTIGFIVAAMLLPIFSMSIA